MLKKFVLISIVLFTTELQAGFFDNIKSYFNAEPAKTNSAPATENTGSKKAPLSNQTVTDGIRDALMVGSKKAIGYLSAPGGFFKDEAVKIPMPDSIKKIDALLRKTGQSKMADEFIETMNRAAEKATPKSLNIIENSIKSMNIVDVMKIYKGQTNAATEYFQKTTEGQLTNSLKPVVSEFTEKVGVTSKYKKILAYAKPYMEKAKGVTKNLGSVSALLGSNETAQKYMKKTGIDFTKTDFLDAEKLYIDQYVTGKTIKGLFVKLADEEKLIRKDPVARTTDILKKVFGKMF